MSCPSYSIAILMAYLVSALVIQFIAKRTAEWFAPPTFLSVVIGLLIVWAVLVFSVFVPGMLVMMYDSPDAQPICSYYADGMMLQGFYLLFPFYIGFVFFFYLKIIRTGKPINDPD